MPKTWQNNPVHTIVTKFSLPEIKLACWFRGLRLHDQMGLADVKKVLGARPKIYLQGLLDTLILNTPTSKEGLK